MTSPVFATILLTGFTVAFLHAAIPTHWLQVDDEPGLMIFKCSLEYANMAKTLKAQLLDEFAATEEVDCRA